MTTALQNVQRWATITPDGVYRYALTRSWDPEPDTTEQHKPVVWVMLNPSTADGQVDDPTVVRCVGHTRRWGYCHLTVVNLYAYRATDPRELALAAGAGFDVVGPLNDDVVRSAIEGAGLVVAAWGAMRLADRRTPGVVAMADRLHCLGRTTSGHPCHPLARRPFGALEVYR